MVMNGMDKNQTKLIVRTNDYNVPKDHIARFVVEFIEESMKKMDIPIKEKKDGRHSFNICSMLKLLIYAKIEHMDSARVIADMAKYHDIFKYVCDGITPSERSIQRYRDEYGEYYEQLLRMTLKKAFDENLSEFNHVAIDGTIKKGFNSNHNTISKKETRILINYYNGVKISDEILDKLHKPAKNLIKNTKLSDKEKLEKLYDIETQFTLTGQDKIPMNDIEARKMKGKKGNFYIAYNIQSAVDYDTKLICAVNVTQSPTDHYELPPIADKTIKNLGKTPKHISADTIYLNPTSLAFFKNNNIDGLIPTRKQSKEKIGKLNKNPFHKDHFEYNGEKDAFKCPSGQYLTFYNQYTIETKDPEKPTKIKRLYNNYQACKNCKYKKDCISQKQSHRTITENGDRLQIEMFFKMEKTEYQEEYSKRPCVEGPFGTLKEYYHIEQEVVIGKTKTEQRINLDALAYNIKRLYNIITNKNNNKEDINKFCENISITHQLELDVFIK